MTGFTMHYGSSDDNGRPAKDLILAVTASPDEFDEDDRARGDRVRQIIALTVVRAVFEVGSELSVAFHKFARMGVARGRNSRYGRWLHTYLPALDRKTFNRWRTAYERFEPLVRDEIGTGCLDFFYLFQLTAVYALCHLHVSDSHRLLAIRLAQSGFPVGPDEVLGLVSSARSHSRVVFKKKIVLPAGTIHLSINHEDFRQALQEAIWKVEEAAGKSDSRHVAQLTPQRQTNMNSRPQSDESDAPAAIETPP